VGGDWGKGGLAALAARSLFVNLVDFSQRLIASFSKF
jgi:hypothetical protein